MIKHIHMKNFKKFHEVELLDLGNINIVLGTNNIGKSSILEGIYTLASGQNLAPIFNNLIARRTNGNILGQFDYMERILAFNKDEENNINNQNFSFVLEATLDDSSIHKFKHLIKPSAAFGDLNLQIPSGGSIEIDNGNFRINNNIQKLGEWEIRYENSRKGKPLNEKFPLTFPPTHQEKFVQPFISGKFVDILSHRDLIENTRIYSFLKREKVMNEFLNEIQRTFPNIKGIDSIPYPDGSPSPVSFELTDSRILPIYNFGDGVQRWFNILGGMILYKNSIHCIEEIDSTFHYGAQTNLSENLVRYSKKYHNQIFLTSHSIEFIDNFLETLYGENSNSEIEDDFVKIITLIEDPNNKNKILSRTLNGLEAYKTREDFGLELR